jgi:hypothetical protein
LRRALREAGRLESAGPSVEGPKGGTHDELHEP